MRKKASPPYFKDLSRKDYIIQAGKIIKKEGIRAISIRRIARELGCSSASLYRYFKNLDELLYYVHLDALSEYILDLSDREKQWKDIWDVHFGIWRSYAGEAFKKPEAFECIFYRNINKNLGKALKEYYEMFPGAIILVSPFIKEMLQIPGYYERDAFVCRRLVEEGKLTAENAGKFNHVVCTLFLGYFKFIQEQGVNPGDIAVTVERFISEIQDIARLYTADL